MNAPRRLTKRMVEALPRPATRHRDHFDAELRGFHVRVWSSGERTYRLKYIIAGRQRVATIGQHGSEWTAEEARSEAEDLRRIVRRGRDPIAERLAKQKANELQRRRSVTVEQLIDRWLLQGRAANPSKREITWATDDRKLRLHIIPLIGKIPVKELTKGDVEDAQAKIKGGYTRRDKKTKRRGRSIVRGGPGIARSAIMSLSSCLSWAVDQEILDANPVLRVKKEKPRMRERFLSNAEVARLFETLDAFEHTKTLNGAFADMIRMLLLTGARKTEIQALRWHEVDLQRGNIVLCRERSKTGEKVIPLSTHAVQILSARRPQENGPVFPSPTGNGKHAMGLQKAWERIRSQAGLADVRIHDLRHSFASFAVAGGASLPLIAKALGHKQFSSAQRYAHLGHDPVRQLADQVGAAIMKAAAPSILLTVGDRP